MKKILFLFTFFFFATQIIPIKYIGYLCHYQVYDLNDDDAEDDDCPIKCKEKIETELYLNEYLYKNQLFKAINPCNNKFPIYCVKIPKDYIQNILVPPPNCSFTFFS
jgi:hypothetical protein